MQLVEAAGHRMVRLELDNDILRQGAEETGFACVVQETPRNVVLELSCLDREGPLLLFDAADPANTGWFARCQFYVDALTGAVLQTPFVVANHQDAAGRPHPRALRLQIAKEMPAHYRLPGRQPVSEKVLYSVLFNFLVAV
ncbi:MAG: hypothetical protein HY821_23565 [Acidobacteria bacterium]|nr:hypothetical protein [Acidobacteriota bacterium]